MLKLKVLLLVALVSGVQTNLSAQALPEAAAGVPQVTITSAERTGELIFALDQAARVATDELGKVKGFKRDRRLRGWVTEVVADGILVSFVGTKGKSPLSVLYRVTVSSSGRTVGKPESINEPVPLSDEQTRQFGARTVGLKSVEGPCSKTYNSVVFPRASPDANWLVYALPGTKKHGVYPVGGSFRFEVNQEGTAVISSRGFAKSCIELTGQPNLAAFTLSHLLDPNPTEIHVFINLLSQIPMYIFTVDNRAMWSLEQGKVKLVKVMEEKG